VPEAFAASGLEKRYGRTAALRGVSLEVADGEMSVRVRDDRRLARGILATGPLSGRI
jgi:hypothetical protein